MLLPIKTKNPPESFPIITLALIAINIIVYIFTSNGLEIRESVVKQLALTHANASPLTLFSSMFLHGDILHILGNMWFLWLLGAAVEGRLRSIKFLILYLAAGLTGDGLHLLMSMNAPDIPSLGASGAIMGLMGAALWMFPHSKMVIFYWFGYWYHGTWDWRMWGVAIYYLGFDLVKGLLFGTLSGVAHFAHIGGALGGFLMALMLRARQDDTTVSDAKSDLSEVDDFRILTKTSLAKLAAVQPDNPEVAMAWMARSMEYNSVPNEETTKHFNSHLQTLLKTGESAQLTMILVKLSETPGVVHARYLYELALRLEKEGNPQGAMSLLDRCLREPTCDDGLAESATYKLALIHESWFQNFDRALELFQEHQRRWPFSPMEGQVRQRIDYLKTRV